MISRIYQTLNEMMTDRGFVLKDNIAHCDTQTIHVKILDLKKIGKKELLAVIDEMEEEDIKHLILVIPQKLTPLALQELNNTSYEIEIFLYKELLFNITRHYLQPKMKILTIEEKKSLIRQIKQSQLPIIVKTDPVCKYFNAKPGMIFKFERPSVYYRIVV